MAPFTVIVPCYNEEQALSATLRSLQAELPEEVPSQVVVVDDGSSDSTPQLIAEAERQYPNVTAVYHSQNRGYGAALKTGIRHATTELIVIIDADGSYSSDRIRDLLDAAGGSDMVVGSRTGSNVAYPFLRRIPKTLLRIYVSWLARQRIPDINSGLRVFRRHLVESFLNVLPNGFSFTTTLTLALLTNDYEVKFVPIDYAQRIGKSKIRPIRDTLQFVQLIVRTGIYFAPLRVFLPAVLILFTVFVGSLCYDVFVLRDLTEKTLIALMFVMNALMFALLADMIDRRSR